MAGIRASQAAWACEQRAYRLGEASGIIFFVLIIGGTFGILAATGAIEALIVTLSRLLRNQEKWLIPIMMLFFAAGGSLMGMAEETIPILQFGDGISNIFIPTSGYFMAGLALAGIPWIRWMKWILPLILLQYAIAAVAVIGAHLIGYGPF